MAAGPINNPVTLDNLVVSNSASLSGQLINNVQDPVNPQDAATKHYVDALAGGTGALTGSGTVNTVAKFTNTNTVGNSSITDDGVKVLIGESLGVGNVTAPASTLDAHINADATAGIGILTIGNNFTGQNFAATFGVDNGKNVILGTSSANTAWIWKTSAGVEVARVDTKAGNIPLAVTGSAKATGSIVAGGSTLAGRLTINTTDTGALWSPNTNGWDAKYAVVGVGVSAFSTPAVGIGYSATNDAGELVSVSPTVAWKNMNYGALGHHFYVAGGTSASLDIASSGLVTAHSGVEVASGNLTADAGVLFVSKGTTAKAPRALFTGTDVLGTVNTTDGPELVLGLNLTNRKDLMLVDSTNTGVGAPAISFSAGSAQGQYIQAVDIGWNTGQTLGLQLFGGTLAIGNGTNNCAINGTMSCTGLIDLTGQSIYLGRQVLTAASGTYTPTTGTRKVLLRGAGAGGGGGGGAGGSSVLGAGGGGASGGWFEKWINPGAAITGGAYTNSTGGTAGANTGGNGGNGGDATIIIQGTTYTFKGGNGGTGMTAANTAAFAPGGTVNAGTSTGDFQSSGQPGGYGTRLVGPVGAGGLGGSSPFGGGGQGPNGTSGAGTNATGFGAGGGGGVGGLTGQTGGTGSASIIIVDEWR